VNQETAHASDASSLIRRLAFLAVLAMGLTLAWVGLVLVPPWLIVVTPRWLVRGASIGFFQALLGLYILAIPSFVLGLVMSLAVVSRSLGPGHRSRRARAGRWALLCLSGLLGLGLMEAGSAITLRRRSRLAEVPTQFVNGSSRNVKHDWTVAVPPATPGPEAAARPAANREVSIAVVGESSARGEPYHPWVSVGQIVAWQLQRVFPETRFHVEVLAEGGICLEQSVLLLYELKRRPDLVVVFSGHNEFQTRYGWSRNVRHYVEEGPRSRLALIALVRRATSAGRLILDALDRFRGEMPPPARATRELVDHPTCTSEEYAFLREDYGRRMDALAAWCRRIGALPILIVPPSNDGAFEPSRSVLAGSMDQSAREQFARKFLAARALDSTDPRSAIAAYSSLLRSHSEFAETHFRLAQALRNTGVLDEARLHFRQARDLDGLPMRCPTDFQDLVRSAATRHEGLLIDAPRLLESISPDGILDDRLFHDAQHLSLLGQTALAQDILVQLQSHGALGWPKSVPVPTIDLAECKRSFGLDADRWAEVCNRSANFYLRAAFIRYDPEERLTVMRQYEQASKDLAGGAPLGKTGVTSLVAIDRGIDSMKRLDP
jgi:hypothetical protein